MEQRREVCTHLLSLIKRELNAEAERESTQVNNLPRDPKQKRVEMAKLEQARCEAADRIMRVIAEYGILAAANEAEYLQYTLDISKRGDIERKRDDERVSRSKKPKLSFGIAALMLGGDALLKEAIDGHDNLCRQSDTPKLQTDSPRTSTGNRRRDAVSDINPFSSGQVAPSTALPLLSPTAQLSLKSSSSILADNLSPDDGGLYKVTVRSGDFATASKANQLERIAVAGGSVRRGIYTDDAVVTPAVIPLPRAFNSGGLTNSRQMTASEITYARLWSAKAQSSKVMEKSRYADKSFDAARKIHVNHTGRVFSRALPLWSRMSERGSARGERHYSEAFGQPMDHFFVPGHLPNMNS